MPHESSTHQQSNGNLDLDAEIAGLTAMTINQLQREYEALFEEAARSGNRIWLIKRIAWRLQANAYGGLSARARQRAEQLANDADIRMKAPRHLQPLSEPQNLQTAARKQAAVSTSRGTPTLHVGDILTRKYKGRTIEVHIKDHGFEWEGVIYGSLTAVAKAITGSHWNGKHFFGLNKQEPPR